MKIFQLLIVLNVFCPLFSGTPDNMYAVLLKKNFILFLAVLNLCCCAGFSLVVRATLVAVRGLLVAVASLVEHGL